MSRLHLLEEAGRRTVLYADESGFCLQPPLPYLWQKTGQTVGLPAKSHARRLNVLGFMSKGTQGKSATQGKSGCLYSFSTQDKVTADYLVQSIETLLPTLKRPTVIVLDNASVHRAKVVREKQSEWKQRGLRLLFLPPYCPHLNKIETLWRMMKYHWLAPQAYRDFATLCQSVTDILKEVGTKYRITYA